MPSSLWIRHSLRKSHQRTLAKACKAYHPCSASLYAFTFIRWKFYLVFLILPAAFTVTFWFLAEETTGKSLEEMGELFGDPMMVQTLNEKAQEGPSISETAVDTQQTMDLE